MTGIEWLEAAKFALEVLTQLREGKITKSQAGVLLDRIGIHGLLPGDRGPGREATTMLEQACERELAR